MEVTSGFGNPPAPAASSQASATRSALIEASIGVSGAVFLLLYQYEEARSGRTRIDLRSDDRAVPGCRHLFGGVTCRGKSLGEDVELILTFFNYCSSNAPRAIGIKGIGNP